MLAGTGPLRARVLASLATAAAEADNLPLAARALGALKVTCLVSRRYAVRGSTAHHATGSFAR
jgi:hypothetical protein